MLPPSLEELELLLSVPADWVGWDAAVGVAELEPDDVVVVDVVAALWLAATAVTPNRAAAPATVAAIATRMRVVRDRTGGVMHPG